MQFDIKKVCQLKILKNVTRYVQKGVQIMKPSITVQFFVTRCEIRNFQKDADPHLIQLFLREGQNPLGEISVISVTGKYFLEIR